MAQPASDLRGVAAALALLLLCAAAGFADTFSFSTDRMTTVLAKGKEHTILSGHAVVVSGDTVLSADQIELYGSDFRYAVCTGNVKVVEKKKGITLTAQNLFYDRTDDLSRVDGYAEMVDQKNQLVVKGDFLENRGKEGITIVQIGVRILRVSEGKVMVCRSEFARYDRNADFLELSGMPVVYWKGDTYRASRISVNLKNDEIHLQGDVSGIVKSESSTPAGEQAGGGATKGGAAAGGTGATAPAKSTAGASASGTDATKGGAAAGGTGAPAPAAAEPSGAGAPAPAADAPSGAPSPAAAGASSGQ